LKQIRSQNEEQSICRKLSCNIICYNTSKHTKCVPSGPQPGSAGNLRAPSAVTISGYGRYRHSYMRWGETEFGNFNRSTGEQEASRFGWRVKIKRIIGDIRKRQGKIRVPKDY